MAQQITTVTDLFGCDSSWSEEEIGSVEELGWYALAEFNGKWYILEQTSDGSKYTWPYDTEEKARIGWAIIEQDYELFYASE